MKKKDEAYIPLSIGKTTPRGSAFKLGKGIDITKNL